MSVRGSVDNSRGCRADEQIAQAGGEYKVGHVVESEGAF